uniref:Uncharacterized protein n=1 Tax=Rhizophora mucronata TaxID=61149 RepID=A0A2P2Q623_RHIMU
MAVGLKALAMKTTPLALSQGSFGRQKGFTV